MSSSSDSYVGDLDRFLFGSITGIDDADLLRQAAAAALALAGIAVFYRAFLVMTFDESQARLLGLRPRLAHVVLLVLRSLDRAVVARRVGRCSRRGQTHRDQPATQEREQA